MPESQGLKLVALHEFLVKQDDHLINELYEHPATCMSGKMTVLSFKCLFHFLVFRELPEIAKHVIMRILFINQPIARQVFIVVRFYDKNQIIADRYLGKR